MKEPKNGEMVNIKPAHARVPMGESAGAVFLPLEGRDVVWSKWWWQRRRDGDIAIVDPTPPKQAPKPAKKDAE